MTTCIRRAQLRGFTLIELMVVVALAGIMLSLGAPALKDFIVGQRVKTAAFAFANAAVHARSEAIKRNGEVVLLAATGGWSQGWSVRSGSTVLSQQEALPSVTIASLPPKVTATQINYQSSGRLSGAVDDLQFSSDSGSHARCISFDLSGQPRSRMGAC